MQELCTICREARLEHFQGSVWGDKVTIAHLERLEAFIPRVSEQHKTAGTSHCGLMVKTRHATCMHEDFDCVLNIRAQVLIRHNNPTTTNSGSNRFQARKRGKHLGRKVNTLRIKSSRWLRHTT